jgi:hypothetical protein
MPAAVRSGSGRKGGKLVRRPVNSSTCKGGGGQQQQQQQQRQHVRESKVKSGRKGGKLVKRPVNSSTCKGRAAAATAADDTQHGVAASTSWLPFGLRLADCAGIAAEHAYSHHIGAYRVALSCCKCISAQSRCWRHLNFQRLSFKQLLLGFRSPQACSTPVHLALLEAAAVSTNPKPLKHCI